MIEKILRFYSIFTSGEISFEWVRVRESVDLPWTSSGEEDSGGAGGGPGGPGGELPGGGVVRYAVTSLGPQPRLVGGGRGEAPEEVLLHRGLGVVRNDERDPVLSETSEWPQSELQQEVDDRHPALTSTQHSAARLMASLSCIFRQVNNLKRESQQSSVSVHSCPGEEL